MSLYDDLGVPKDADPAAIKRAHREKVRKLHPDNAETGNRNEFEAVQRAYIVLSSPKKRARYDETGDFEDAPENPIAELTNIIMGGFDEAMTELQHVFEHRDVILRTRHFINVRKARIEASVAGARETVKHLDQVLDRVIFNSDGFDPIGNALRDRRQQIERNISFDEETMAKIDSALIYLDHYGFKFEEEAPARQTYTMFYLDPAS